MMYGAYFDFFLYFFQELINMILNSLVDYVCKCTFHYWSLPINNYRGATRHHIGFLCWTCTSIILYMTQRWVKCPAGSLWVPTNQCSPSLLQTCPDPLWIMNPGRRCAPDHKSYLEARLDMKLQEMALFRSNSAETPHPAALNPWPSLRKCCAKVDTEAHDSSHGAKVCSTQRKWTLFITFN